jgi:hypothetical protein
MDVCAHVCVCMHTCLYLSLCLCFCVFPIVFCLYF